MIYYRYLIYISVFVSLLFIQGCGSGGGFLGGGETNGTLSLTSSATVVAGKSVQATAKFTSTKGVTPVPVTFSSSDPTVIASTTGWTNSSGDAIVLLSAANIINSDKTITITASTGSLLSSTQITVKANKLVVTPPDKGAITWTAGAGLTYFIAGTGNLITYTDADGNALNGRQVEIRLTSQLGLNNVNWVDNLSTGTFSFTAPSPPHIYALTGNLLPNDAINLELTAPPLPTGTASDYAAFFIATIREPGCPPFEVPFNIQVTVTSK
jgi:hypothetical protein